MKANLNPDLLSLKLYSADNGDIWYLNGDGLPTNTHTSLVPFLLLPMATEMPRLRIIGIPQNVQLILSLFVKRLSLGGTIEVCSPLVCHTAAERKDPQRALYAMRQCERASGVGGWHTFRKDDYLGYRLTAHLQKMGVVDDAALAMLKTHPVWAPLCFIPHLNQEACCRLLALIGDPRWFVNSSHTARGSNLRSFLGLDLHTMNQVIFGRSTRRYVDRCKLVFNCWYHKEDLVNIDEPAYFLWRIFRMHSEKRDMTIGALRASQAFVEYIRLTWLASVGRGHHQTEALFVPNHYFKIQTEVDAFYEHFVRYFEKKKE